MQKQIKTQKQQEIVSNLVNQFGIDGERILFLNSRDENDPWIPPSVLEQIARQMEGYRSSSVQHDKFIPQTSQTVYLATVTDSLDRVFTRSGVATVGEANEVLDEIDTDYLAMGRALSAALNAAGFNPVKAIKMVDFREEAAYEKLPKKQFAVEDEAIRRTKDLGVIHALAEKKELIKTLEGGVRDMTEYRRQLHAKFGTNTAAMFDASQRAAVINWLNNYDAFLEEVPAEFREDAMYA